MNYGIPNQKDYQGLTIIEDGAGNLMLSNLSNTNYEYAIMYMRGNEFIGINLDIKNQSAIIPKEDVKQLEAQKIDRDHKSGAYKNPMANDIAIAVTYTKPVAKSWFWW